MRSICIYTTGRRVCSDDGIISKHIRCVVRRCSHKYLTESTSKGETFYLLDKYIVFDSGVRQA